MAADFESVGLDVSEVATHEEMDIVTVLSEAGAVVAADGAAADDGDAGGFGQKHGMTEGILGNGRQVLQVTIDKEKRSER